MPVSAPPKKGLTLVVVAATLVCQLLLCRSLGRLSTLLSGSISDAEGDDVLRYEAARALLTLGQLWTAASLGVAIAGLVGIAKSILPVLRLVALHGFLDLSVLLVLLSLLSFLSFSSPSFSTSLCQFLSSTELLSDVLGFGLEECEARWKSLAMGTLGVLALVAGCRAFAAVKSLQYYVAVTKRAKRGGLKINTSGSGVGRLYSDSHGPSRDSSSPSSHKQRPRIFLLPSPLATKRDDDPSIPLLSLTPSSPAENTSFPPIPYGDDSEQSTPTTTHHVRAHSQEQTYIVYAPVSPHPSSCRTDPRTGSHDC